MVLIEPFDSSYWESLFFISKKCSVYAAGCNHFKQIRLITEFCIWLEFDLAHETYHAIDCVLLTGLAACNYWEPIWHETQQIWRFRLFEQRSYSNCTSGRLSPFSVENLIHIEFCITYIVPTNASICLSFRIKQNYRSSPNGLLSPNCVSSGVPLIHQLAPFVEPLSAVVII